MVPSVPVFCNNSFRLSHCFWRNSEVNVFKAPYPFCCLKTWYCRKYHVYLISLRWLRRNNATSKQVSSVVSNALLETERFCHRFLFKYRQLCYQTILRIKFCDFFKKKVLRNRVHKHEHEQVAFRFNISIVSCSGVTFLRIRCIYTLHRPTPCNRTELTCTLWKQKNRRLIHTAVSILCIG